MTNNKKTIEQIQSMGRYGKLTWFLQQVIACGTGRKRRETNLDFETLQRQNDQTDKYT